MYAMKKLKENGCFRQVSMVGKAGGRECLRIFKSSVPSQPPANILEKDPHTL